MSTGKRFPIRAPQYWGIGPKGGCRGIEYSKTLKKPLSSSTGFVSNTHIYHNACTAKKILFSSLNSDDKGWTSEKG